MEKKKTPLKNLLTEHGFDFITLFLAVMLGFFADNYRDKVEAEETTNQLANELIADISSDTININEMILHANHKMHQLENLYLLLNEHHSESHDSLIYLSSACVNHRPLFERNSSSFIATINTGHLSYFSKPALKAITKYNIECEKISDLLRQERLILDSKIYPFQQKIFDTENFLSIVSNKTLSTKPIIRDWSDESKWIYKNYVIELKIINARIKEHYHALFKEANRTINILNSEYIKD